jgi:hypothetical protein
MDDNVFDQRAFKDQLPLAWGAVPATAGQYYPIDLICIRLSDELATMLGYTDASALVRTHFDAIAETVARMDGGFRWEGPFCVAAAIRGEGTRPECLVTSGVAEEIIHNFNESGFPYQRIILVNVSRIAFDLRKSSERLGIDLSEPFFRSRDHPKFAQSIGAAERARKAALAALKKRDPGRAARHRLKPLGKALAAPETG